MNKSMLLWDRLKKNRLVALLSPERAEDCIVAYEALHPLGVVLEVALRTPAALDGIRAVRQRHPDALIMAGTVLTRHQAECAVDAGVAGVVSPDYIPIVVEVCARKNIMCVPGGMGDVGKQLVYKAQLYSCEMDELSVHYPYQWVYKLFPAAAGNNFLLDAAPSWKSIYKGVTFIYTGGIHLGNVATFAAKDPDGIICASALTKDVNDPEEMKKTAEEWLAAIRDAKLEDVEAAESQAAGTAAEVISQWEKGDKPESGDEGDPPAASGEAEEPEASESTDSNEAAETDEAKKTAETGEAAETDEAAETVEASESTEAPDAAGETEETPRPEGDGAGPGAAMKRTHRTHGDRTHHDRPVPKGEGEAVVTFGEVMLRLAPPKGLRFGQGIPMDSTFGGAEANVAVALANYGLDARFVTALPDHAMGQAALNVMRSFGVDTDHVLHQGDRIGIYYLEHGASQRPSKVIYDRANSAISRIQPGQVDWETVFRDARWFHWSGITPALSDSAAEATMEALQAAKAADLFVSVDLNYRGKLWSEEKAREVMTPMMEYVDLIIGNEEDATTVFGIRCGTSDYAAGELDLSAYQEVTRELVEQFGCKMAALTLRESKSASDNDWSACLFDGEEFYLSKKYSIHVVDRVGGGDAFSSGLIYSLMNEKRPSDALEFAVAASCLKQTIYGDFNIVSAKEVENLSGGDTSGRIKR